MVDRSGGSAFDDPDVARAYAYRPDYPEEMFSLLADLAPDHDRLLDLGCGPGKIAHGLALAFREVDAVDPSLPMLQAGDDGWHPNIRWIHSTAEEADLSPEYDLVTAGASMHWMDHAIIFPRLAKLLAHDGMVAVVEGDEVSDAAWSDERFAFLQRWVERLGGQFDHQRHRAALNAYEQWMFIHGRRDFTRTVCQPVQQFIEGQHSRATWTRANLGHLVDEFSQDLRQMLEPFAENDTVSYTVNTSVVWGVPR